MAGEESTTQQPTEEEKEVYHHTEQEQEPGKARKLTIDEFLAPAIVPERPADAAAGDAAVPQAEGGINEAGSELQAENTDGYEDEAEDGDYDYEYEYGAEEYDDDAEYDDYDYEYDYEEEEYDYGLKVLASFPEAASLEPHELAASVERLLEQSKPEYDNVAAPGKIRLLKEDIKLALDNWTAPPPSIFLDWFPDERLSADSVRSGFYKEMDKEFLEQSGKSEEKRERELFRVKVRTELIEKGYVEVDEDYYEKKDEYERQCMQQIQEEWDQKMHFRRSRGAKNE